MCDDHKLWSAHWEPYNLLLSKSPCQTLFCCKYLPGGGYSTGIWVGGFGRLNETLTLLKTQRCRFCFPVWEKVLQFHTLFKTGPSVTVFKAIQVCIFTNYFKGAQNQQKLCDWRERKGEDLRWRPCLGHENVKLYTPCKMDNPENDTMMGGTSPHRKYSVWSTSSPTLPPTPPGNICPEVSITLPAITLF